MMRCNKCYHFPMEESEEDASILICKKCGNRYKETKDEHLNRYLYEKGDSELTPEDKQEIVNRHTKIEMEKILE